MIATLTLNPSLDYMVKLTRLTIGAVNRSESAVIRPGGKGINVSIMLTRLEIETRALGFIAGQTGYIVRNLLHEERVNEDLIELKKGMTRINVKISDQKTTEINGVGPVIDDKALDSLLTKLDTLGTGDFLVMSGSIPGSLPSDSYGQIMQVLQGKGIEFVVDAEGPALQAALVEHPFLIKPNVTEIGQLYGYLPLTDDDVIDCARRAQEDGARNVLVSRGAEGAILLTENDEAFIGTVPEGKVVNTVGAGDSMVAGFLAEWINSADMEYALGFSVDVGSATAYSPWLADAETTL